jgi:hypothetical protein
MDDSESAALADRPDPTVSGAPIQALPVLAAQDRSFVPLTDNQIDRPRRAGHERDRGGLAALAEDPQRAMAALHRQVLNVGSTRLRHSQPIETKKHGQRGVIAVEPFGSEQERAQLGTVHAVTLAGRDLGATDVLGRVRRDSSVDVSEPVEAAHRRQPTVNRRGRKPTLFHRGAVQLAMCGLVALRTSNRLSDAHWKKARRSCRYASNVRPL